MALGGGAAWGGAHLGALRVLDEAGIVPACLAGASSGAIAGAFYAAGVPFARAQAFATRLRWRTLRLIRVPRLGFLHSSQMERLLREEVGDLRIEDLTIPLAVVATDLRTARPVVFREGSLAHALTASSAVPVVFSPVVDGDALLVDGGLSDNLPTEICRGMGADVVLALNVVPGFGPARQYRHLLDIALATLELLVEPSTERGAEAADLCVRTDLGTTRASDLAHMPQLVTAGEAAMREALPRLVELLAAHGPAARPLGG